jgi:hypothetical protein
MNTQEIIQALSKEQLLVNAKMQAYDNNTTKLSMLIVIATDPIPTYAQINNVQYQLAIYPDQYV